MGRLRTIARRTFLVGSVAIVGGVAFGTYMMQRRLPNPLEADLGDGEATFNPWVLIDSEKVTLITPHGDKGQGVMSAPSRLDRGRTGYRVRPIRDQLRATVGGLFGTTRLPMRVFPSRRPMTGSSRNQCEVLFAGSQRSWRCRAQAVQPRCPTVS